MGGIASGRVPPGIAEGDLISSWLNPTSALSGALAVGITAYLAAVFLTHDAARSAQAELVEALRRSALVTGVVVGAVSAVGLLVLRADTPDLFAELTSGRAWPAVMASVVAGVLSLVLLWRRRYVAVRVTAALAVVGLLWGWGLGQYPYLLPGVTLDDAAATDAVLAATLGALAVGAVFLVPSLFWLYATFQRDRSAHLGGSERSDPTTGEARS